MSPPVRAAGGILWRRAGDETRICVVHRPAHDDWSLPKGKLHTGEHSLVAAVREVFEETGVRGRPQLRLPEVSYVLPDGVPKTVDFWLMRAADGPAGQPADPAEVDGVDWLTPRAAMRRLTYGVDARLVEHAMDLPPVTSVVALIRHGRAGQRAAWAGPDALRPLDPEGLRQAATLAEVLALLEPRRLVTAPPVRCVQTVQPLADRLGLPLEQDATMAEPPEPDEAPQRAKAAAARLALVRMDATAVVCTQGKLIAPLLALLDNADDPVPYKTPKGGGWVLTWSGERLIGLTRL
ncbi:8-oxo-dGTP diphosphatase [Krasilnikovia cinnamomea]|uniref:8-oxo-dGTP diphosphatase n=1 Tax=Krasilnikovia cinnamomea TaxID=349313 RepID=A0A4Q7ZGA6_9ACTN|nr:NUDIX hydrolase [Krasilnikovia cinnamomea]RZU49820.1 8-oxo-dGTP diphosphatase [Krasilnikovia cinnamomea]